MMKFFTVFGTLLSLLFLSPACFSQCTGCTTTLTTSSAATINVSSGVYCIDASSGDITISGPVTVSGTGTLCVNASAGNINFTGNLELGKNCTMNFYSASDKTSTINSWSEGAGPDPRTLNNYGNLTVNVNVAGSVVTGWRVFKTSINNSGTLNVTNGFEIGGGNVINNSGTFNVGAGIQSNGAFWTNSGTLAVTGNFTASAASTFTNSGTWNVTGNNTVNFNLTNGGTMNVGGTLTINASGTLNFQNGRVYTYDLLLNDGSMTTGTGCAAIVVTNNSNANANGFSVTVGSVDITDLSQSSGTPGLDANTCPAGPPANCGLTFSTSTATNSCLSSSLPVSLISFKGKYLNASQVALEWTTANEKNNLQFIVERTEDLKTFYPVSTVTGTNNSEENTTYKINDNFSNSGEDVFYRLSQKDIDGTVHDLGMILPDRPDGEFTVDIYPNPNKGQFKVSCQGIHAIRHIHILDHTGKAVYVHDDFSSDPNQTFTFNLEGLKGIYILSVATEEEIFYSKINIE